jgi:HJR/Mrr/RecB family endonuclease
MQAQVTTPFKTAYQKFAVGDTVDQEVVGDVLFYACTDAKMPAQSSPKPPKQAEPKAELVSDQDIPTE